MAEIVRTLLRGPCSRMPWYTDLKVLFEVLGGRERDFDWLLTELECNQLPLEFLPDREAWFVRGEVLSEWIRGQQHPAQFIWGVLTGFDRGTVVDVDDLRVVPCADGNSELWSGRPRIQYPDARVEIVCWDSGATILVTEVADLTARFRAGFAEAVEL